MVLMGIWQELQSISHVPSTSSPWLFGQSLFVPLQIVHPVAFMQILHCGGQSTYLYIFYFIPAIMKVLVESYKINFPLGGIIAPAYASISYVISFFSLIEELEDRLS